MNIDSVFDAAKGFRMLEKKEYEAARTIVDKDSSISVLFLFCLVLQNQKLIHRINGHAEKNVKLTLIS
jgi:hypothetical protein